MKTTSTLFLAATLCASALVVRPARAQSWTPPFDFSPQLGARIMEPQLEAQRDRAAQGASSARKATDSVRRVPKKALTTTTYRESSDVTKRVVKGFTDRIAAQASASDAATIRTMFENDMVGIWAKDVAADGLKRGDVADALTDYWVKNWMIANRVTFTTRAQVQAVRRLMVSVLSSTPAFAKASNAQRQEMAEGYIYNSVLQSGAFVQVFHTGDKALIKKASDARAASFKTETGFDLRSVKLTNTGFAPK